MKNIAFDLGGSSGKMALGSFNGRTLEVQMIHRFHNHPIDLHGNLYWNTLGIYEELIAGIAKGCAGKANVKSVGIDSFCNDFAFVDQRGALLSQMHAYRDPRAQRYAAQAYAACSPTRLHQITGNQNAMFNTVMQLSALVQENKDYLFKSGNSLLLLPDLMGFLLTGKKRAEYSVSSVTQMLDYKTGDWSDEILSAFKIPRALLQPLILAGEVLGDLRPELQDQLGAREMQVVSVCAHDTASAIAALPTNRKDVAFISSGTWSLVGTELEQPIVNEQTFTGNFAIEGGADKKSRLLKNVMGLWLVQECKRSFLQHGQDYTYHDLGELAQKETAFRSLIDPDDPIFYMPNDMPKKIAQHCAQTGQPIPKRVGQVVRCILESLALKYRWVMDELERVGGKPLREIYILGGGGQDIMLDQFTANACARPVYVGPTEAAICGNILLQLRAYREVDGMEEGRDMLARSMPSQLFLPEDILVWQEQYRRFQDLFHLS